MADWNAREYDQLPLPHLAWGIGVLDRLRLTGEERLLDAGCGTGRDLERALTAFPAVTAVGIDVSPAMLEQAAARLAPFGRRVEVHLADLTRPLTIGEPADAVMSVAAFHWIHDHASLFSHLAAVMRPGARLATDCGGAGNIANVRTGVERMLGPRLIAQHYADAEVTASLLVSAGFDVLHVTLRPDPLQIDDPALRSCYLKTVCLGPELATIAAKEHDTFVDAVRDAMPEPTIDYVRLEITAIRR